ncbi:MAG TPA: hypothetical protein VFJ43_08280 [Bacteroidia bacterium]|nr:hypothetical protein [Bacteroidia bacterium]
MNIETCQKYLTFVASEADRYLGNGGATDDHVVRMTAELNKFKKDCAESNLPQVLKNEISLMRFDYDSTTVNRSLWLLVACFLTFGIWAIIIYFKGQAVRKERLEEIKYQANSLAMKIKMNY